MKLWLRITQGLAALLLSAAAVSLLLFAGALLLGIAAAALLAAAGLYLAAPENARKTFSLLVERIDAWVAAMQSIVDNAGNLVQSFLNPRAAAPEKEPEAKAASPRAADPEHPEVSAGRTTEEKSSER